MLECSRATGIGIWEWTVLLLSDQPSIVEGFPQCNTRFVVGAVWRALSDRPLPLILSSHSGGFVWLCNTPFIAAVCATSSDDKRCTLSLPRSTYSRNDHTTVNFHHSSLGGSIATWLLPSPSCSEEDAPDPWLVLCKICTQRQKQRLLFRDRIPKGQRSKVTNGASLALEGSAPPQTAIGIHFYSCW